MKEYRVIWFDDECKSGLKKIRGKAFENNIKLFGFENSDDGIAELKNNISYYDAAILDGIFYKTRTEIGDAHSDEAMGEVAKELIRLESIKKLPWAILSGQPSFTNEKNRFAEALKEGKVYDKYGDDDHLASLWDYLKNEADKQPDTQARHNNQEIFEIFELGYLSDSVEDQVLKLLTSSLSNDKSSLKAILANIRSVHESCFNKLEQINLIPNASDKISAILYHLSGRPDRNNDYKPVSTVYITKDINNLHQWIYYTCGTYIHNLKNSEHDYQISNYGEQSLISGILEILLWFKKIYQENK